MFQHLATIVGAPPHLKNLLELRAGFEPTTFGLQNRCSTIKANRAFYNDMEILFALLHIFTELFHWVA